MPFILDTNIAILLRDRDEQTISRLVSLEDSLALSVITLVELKGGLDGAKNEIALRRQRLEVMLGTFEILPFDEEAAEVYGHIVLSMGYSRRKVLDRMIAAQAIAAGAILVTLNAADFREIPGLSVLAW